MTKLGQYLKTERERKGLTVHEIGLSLKINPKILAALEEGQKEGLPAKTFLRGFVKSYAQFLRLNTDEALQLFSDEYGPKPEVPNLTIQSSSPTASPTNEEKSPILQVAPMRKTEDRGSSAAPTNNNKSLWIFGGVVLFVLVIFVAKMVDKYQKERELHPLPPVGTSASAVEPETKLSVTPEEQPEPMTSTGPQTSTAPVSTENQIQAPAATPAPTPTPSPTPSPTPKPETRPNEVILETLSNVSVKYTLENGNTQSFELGPDKLHTIRAKGTISLELSDGGAVNLIVNGRDRGVPGSPGKSLKINLPK